MTLPPFRPPPPPEINLNAESNNRNINLQPAGVAPPIGLGNYRPILGDNAGDGVDLGVPGYQPPILPPREGGNNNPQGDGDLFPIPPIPNIPNFGNNVIPPGYTNTRRGATDKKRRITVSRNELDPLSEWYFSKVKYGNKDGLRIIRPTETDHSLKLISRQSIQPNFQWSIAPIRDVAVPPRQTTSDSLIQFLNAIDPTPLQRQEHYRNLYNQGNPYISVNKPIEGSSENYRSMPAEMMEAVLTTSERILSVFSMFNINGDPVPLQENLETMAVRLFEQRNPPALAAVEDPKVRFFFDKLETLGIGVIFEQGDFVDAIINYRQEVRTRVVDNRQDITLYTIISEILMMIANDEVSRERELRLCRYIVSEVMRRVVDPSQLINLLKDNLSYDGLQRYVEIDTPYITTRSTNNFLKDDVSSNFTAKIMSDYNFYAQDYEELQGDFSILELPNTYVRQNYVDLQSIRERDILTQQKYNEMENLITLNGEYNTQGQHPGEIFYNRYAKALQVAGDTLPLQEKHTSIIFESHKVRDTKAFSYRPPMALGVQYYRDGDTEINNLLNELELTDFRNTMFENISRQSSDVARVATRYATEYLTRAGISIHEEESDFLLSPLKEFNFVDLIDPISSQQPDEPESLIVGESSFLTNEDLLGVLEEGVHSVAQQKARQSPLNILNAVDSDSVLLGHRIAKKQAGSLVQDFYIASGIESRSNIYVDSQIHYGDEYSYELFEYRLVYGTKYKFNAVAANAIGASSTIPMWVFQYYLGINTRLTQRQILDERPNIYFSCFMEPTADYSVVEIPIYSPDYVPQSSNNMQAPARQSSRFDLTPRGLEGIRNLDNISLASLRREPLMESIVYPVGKVLDYPPTPPILSVFPLVGNESQVKVNANLQTGALLGDQAVEIISIGDQSEQIGILKDYQDNFKNFFLPPGILEFRNEGIGEVRNIVLYRTTNINLNVETYKEIYASFDPIVNSSVLVRSYSDKGLGGDLPVETVSSYDLLEDILANTNYYYTCVVEDIHGNVSNPSIIYRVRLVVDKGLIIPEVDTVLPLGIKPQTPTKDLTRYIKIKASDIQSLPVVITSGDEAKSERSLGKSLNNSIEDQSYIVRLTSKDTGRKFDLKLNFVVRVNGEPING